MLEGFRPPKPSVYMGGFAPTPPTGAVPLDPAFFRIGNLTGQRLNQVRKNLFPNFFNHFYFSKVAILSGKMRIAVKISFQFMSFFFSDFQFWKYCIWSILCMVDHIHDRISKTKSRKNLKYDKKSFSEQCASFQKIWHLLNKIIFFISLFGTGPKSVYVRILC